MRIFALTMMACLAGAACAQDQDTAILDWTVLDATPVVPLRAIQIFQVDEAGRAGEIGSTWGEAPLPMPDQGSISFTVDLPPPFRMCEVALGDPGDVIVHAVSPPVQLVFEQTMEVFLTLEEAPGGEVPEPCGAGVQPWPPEA